MLLFPCCKPRNFGLIARRLFYALGLRRCGKSCRLRWLNYLRPDIKHGGFTEEEDYIICTLYNSMGSRQVYINSFTTSECIVMVLINN